MTLLCARPLSAAPRPSAHLALARRRAPALLGLALLIGLAARLWLSAVMPLADTTEARYGEIVRVGLEHGFWLMPHATPAEPFFAKPPASTWLSMLTATAFGVSEPVLRLPSLLLVLGVAATCGRLAAREAGDAPLAAPWAWAVLLLSPLGFVLAGAVMTDAIHLLAVTLAMAGATWVLSDDPRTRSAGRVLFWAALGAGTLAKGLATVALATLPVALYGLAGRRPIALARRFLAPAPIALALAVALPWYVAAEHAYPGFLRYFIVGEHLQRFLEPGWQGDRYGAAHHHAIGTVWVYAAAAAGPWLLAALAVAVAARRGAWTSTGPRTAAGPLWWTCWIVAPLLLFTFSRNIIWTYAATALPPLAVRLGAALARSPVRGAVAAGAFAWALALGAASPWLAQQIARNSAKSLIARIPSVDPLGAMPLTVPGELRFSGAFYSRGRACIAEGSESEAACEAASGGSGLRILGLGRAREWARDGTAEIVATDARHALLLRPPHAGAAR